jgi:hypothetical protein
LFSDQCLTASSAAAWPMFGGRTPSKTRADALHPHGVPEGNRWGSSGTGKSERRVTLDELMAPAERRSLPIAKPAVIDEACSDVASHNAKQAPSVRGSPEAGGGRDGRDHKARTQKTPNCGRRDHRRHHHHRYLRSYRTKSPRGELRAHRCRHRHFPNTRQHYSDNTPGGTNIYYLPTSNLY